MLLLFPSSRNFGGEAEHHSGLLDLHAATLGHKKQRLQELEATSYYGRLIWKIEDFGNRREAEVKGQVPCLKRVPFQTGRCGYKMASNHCSMLSCEGLHLLYFGAITSLVLEGFSKDAIRII